MQLIPKKMEQQQRQRFVKMKTIGVNLLFCSRTGPGDDGKEGREDQEAAGGGEGG
jgi:hypothetical protein